MTDYYSDIEEMKDLLKLANPKVTKSVTIETPETLGQNFLFHIATDKRSLLFPNISKRAASSEDNTMPRVHASTSLMGCWYGYASGGYMAANFEVETEKKKSNSKSPKTIYKGGFYIHQIPFRCVLKPSKALVYDAAQSDEIWMVTYNELTPNFQASIIGTVVPVTVTYLPVTGEKPVEVVTLIVKVLNNQKINLMSSKGLKKGLPEELVQGCWMFDISNKLGINNFTSIPEHKFMEMKMKSAGMLGYQ